MSQIKGPKLKSKVTTMLTVRFKSHAQYASVAEYARDVLGVSVNEFCVNKLLEAVRQNSHQVEPNQMPESDPEKCGGTT